MVVGVGVAFMIFLNAFAYPKIERTGKRFFLTSTIFSALGIHSPMAVVLMRGLHGLEYTFLSHRMFKRSTVGKLSVLTIAIVVIIVAIHLFICWITPRNALTNVPKFPEGLLQAAYVIAFVLEFGHYYLDSLLYKFQDADARENIAPLLR
jgi:hypothetical protein